MTSPAEVIGPVVRMCDDPDCGGAPECGSVSPLMGLSDNMPAHLGLSDEAACAHLCQEISLCPASDDEGVQRMVPDGCEFTVHKMTDDLGYSVTYTAVYSGPAPDRSTALAGSPEWDFEAARERLGRMRQAGILDVLAAARP